MNSPYSDPNVLFDIRRNMRNPYSVPHVLLEKAILDSANYVEEHMKDALIFWDQRKRLLEFACSRAPEKGVIAEFGVWQGHSITWIAESLPNKTVYGFDSFVGLQEDWLGWDFVKGTFDMKGILPLVPSNVILKPGFFKDTLPSWKKEINEPMSFINIDSDTYEAAKTILNELGSDYIVSGTLISFDEYFGYRGWRNHEFKAWKEYCQENNVQYKYLAFTQTQVLIEVL